MSPGADRAERTSSSRCAGEPSGPARRPGTRVLPTGSLTEQGFGTLHGSRRGSFRLRPASSRAARSGSDLRRGSGVGFLLLLLAALLPAAASASITEYPIPSRGSGANEITAGP